MNCFKCMIPETVETGHKITDPTMIYSKGHIGTLTYNHLTSFRFDLISCIR